MNRIKRTSMDIKNFKDIVPPESVTSDTQLTTLIHLEHLISSIKEIIKFLSDTPLIYETQRYREPLELLYLLHADLRARYPARPVRNAKLVDGSILRLVQYVDIVPLTFYKERSGETVHGLQSIESRKKVLGYAKVLKDRLETVMELAHLPIP